MARGTAECTCEKCGKTFVKYSYNCRNRSEADRWEEWAKGNYTLCPECYREQQKADNAQKASVLIAELGLPEITGKSEKQIQYASNLRNKELVSRPEQARKIAEWFRMAKDGELDEAAAEKGMTPDELVRVTCQEYHFYGLGNLYTVFTVSDAGKLIDTLKY